VRTHPGVTNREIIAMVKHSVAHCTVKIIAMVKHSVAHCTVEIIAMVRHSVAHCTVEIIKLLLSQSDLASIFFMVKYNHTLQQVFVQNQIIFKTS